MGICKPPRPLDQPMPQTPQLFKDPQRRSLLTRPALRRPHRHLQLAIQIMRQNRRHHKQLISHQISNGNIIHLALRLQFPQNALLGRPAVMIPQNLLPRRPLVRHDHLELIPILMGNKQIQLNRLLADRRTTLADEQKPIGLLPLLRLPAHSKNDQVASNVRQRLRS